MLFKAVFNNIHSVYENHSLYGCQTIKDVYYVMLYYVHVWFKHRTHFGTTLHVGNRAIVSVFSVK